MNVPTPRWLEATRIDPRWLAMPMMMGDGDVDGVEIEREMTTMTMMFATHERFAFVMLCCAVQCC